VEPVVAYLGSLPKELAPRTLRKLFERLGSTYIKLGQFIASSPTLFPEEFVVEFQACLDQSPTVPFETIRSIVEEDLGRSVSDVFAEITETPLASASIAQVHAAKLATGDDVVIKVRKPGVETVLKADLGFLAASTRIIEAIVPDLDRFSFAGIVADLRTSMLEELNFENEARNIGVFSDFLDQSNLRGVAACPVVYPSASGKRVLTMERFNGVAITDVDGIKRYGKDPEKMLVSALNVWTASVVEAESFHADVHAGNILALADGRVGFIDFGIVGRIPPAIWDAVKDLAGSTVTSDFRGMARALVAMGATKGRVDEEAFARDIADVVTELQKVDPELTLSVDNMGSVVGTVQIDDQAVTDVLLRIVSVADRNGVKLPREFGVLLKQYLYFDRYTKILAPGIDVLRDERVELGRVIDVEATGEPTAPRLKFS
jgi:aarF domain-containing kinase